MLYVLLPGMDGTGDHFAPFVGAAPPGVEVKVFSYPGQEAMTFAQYADFVEPALPADGPFVLLGESFSGPISILLAARRPPGLCALVLCNSFVVAPAWSGFRWLPWRRLLSFPVPTLAIGYFLAGFANMSTLAEPIRRSNRKVQADVRASRVRVALTVDVRKELAALPYPVFYLRGRRDHLVRARSLRQIQRVRPDVQVRLLDAPHLLLQTRPRECWEAMQELIDAELPTIDDRARHYELREHLEYGGSADVET